MKQVRNQAEEAQATGEDDQLIFAAEFGEDVLLELLQRTLLAEITMERNVRYQKRTNGKDSFTGTFCRSGGIGSLFTRGEQCSSRAEAQGEHEVTWYDAIYTAAWLLHPFNHFHCLNKERERVLCRSREIYSIL